MENVDDVGVFLEWFYKATQKDIDSTGVPADGAIQTAVKAALENGASCDNLEELYTATSFYYQPPAVGATQAPKKPWEKGGATSSAPAVPTAKKVEDLPSSEDLRSWSEEEVEDLVLDLFDAAFKRHHLPFSLEESSEEVEKTLAWILSSEEEPVSQEDLARRVNNRYAGIARSRNASREIKAAGHHKFSAKVFGKLKTMVRNGSFTEFIAATAARLEDEGHSPESVIAVLERTAYYGGDEAAFDRAYRRVIGTAPTPVKRATGKKAPAAPEEPSRAKKPWER